MRRAILFLLALASIWATVAYAAYSLTDRDSAAIDRAVDRATALIDERGETFRTTLLGRIDKLAERYSKSEKATAILAELKSRIEEYGQEEIPEQEDELSRLFSNAWSTGTGANSASGATVEEESEPESEDNPYPEMPRGRPLTDADTEEVKANMEARQCEKIFNPEDIIGAMNSLFRQREAVADDTWANIERDAGRGNMNPLQVQAIINRSENMYAEHIIELCEFYKSNYACIYDEDLDYDCSAIVPIWPEEDFSTPAFSTATELKREVLGWDSLKNEGYVRDGMNRYYVKLSGGCLMSYDTKIVYEGVVLSSSSQVKVLNGGAFCRVDSITEIK